MENNDFVIYRVFDYPDGQSFFMDNEFKMISKKCASDKLLEMFYNLKTAYIDENYTLKTEDGIELK